MPYLPAQEAATHGSVRKQVDQQADLGSVLAETCWEICMACLALLQITLTSQA